MVFSSHLFLFYFLPFALLLYYAVPIRARHLALTALSYLFYGWSNPAFVGLMLFSTVVDYGCGLVIGSRPEGARRRRQKVALAVSIVTNLGLLGFFKYFNFGVDSYLALLEASGGDPTEWDTFLRITLPLGISFYTFQSMSYSIDVYRGEAKAIRNIIDFACYVSMFPQLVAGPIVRFHEVATQLVTRTHTMEKFARGVTFLSLGMAKKILLANPCGKIADTMFDAGSVGSLDAWFGLCGYSFQIYFDFSAYSDMAIGLGLMFGFVFPKNFDSPYRARSITEFWQRWHLSLSNWLRDYLYIPLGGNRKGISRTYVNLAMVMILGGLWHGASWNFVLWGGIHGFMLAFERMQGRESLYRRLPTVVRRAVTFLIVGLAWVFFRSATLDDATQYLGSLFGFGFVHEGAGLVAGLVYQPYYVVSFVLAAVVTWWAPQSWDFTRQLTPVRVGWCLLLLVVSVAVMTTQSFNPFIYFIF